MIPTLNSNDFRFQRRPGTPLDRAAKATWRYFRDKRVGNVKAATGNREKARNAKRSGRSLATSVSGHVYDGAMTIGE